jgi:multimeric flavodoxin WrbA
MKVLCISASNTNLGKNSASVRVCQLIKDYLKDEVVTIAPLSDYDMESCHLCGECFYEQQCLFDPAFNDLYGHICNSDVIFMVIPHYSPIPSKLLMLLEKLNEITYSFSLHNKDKETHLPFFHKRVGLIGHGGMMESQEVLHYYHDHLLKPIADTLRSLSFDVVGDGQEYPDGMVFGLENDQCLVYDANSVFPKILHDYEQIGSRLKPFIDLVVSSKSKVS